MKGIAILGGGISGVTAAYECSRMQSAGEPIEFTLFESSSRLGGIVSTRHAVLAGSGHCLLELGPDGWISEKPWARDLAIELGLGPEIVSSNDAERRTLLLRDGVLLPIPDGMRMMVPLDDEAIRHTPLLSENARQAYLGEPNRADELRQLAAGTPGDLSVADFVRRHFGDEATRTFAGPLLAGIFGGDIERLSARSTMPFFVALEREHGSLIAGLREQQASRSSSVTPIFTSLRTGLSTLIDAMAARIPAKNLRTSEPVLALARQDATWTVTTAAGSKTFDTIFLATPSHVSRALLLPIDRELAELHNIATSSAVLVAMAFSKKIPLPTAFGFLVQQPQPKFHPALLAGTFSHIKYPHTAPPNAMTLRIFFGGPLVSEVEEMSDDAILDLAQQQLRLLFPDIPAPELAIVQRWPHSLPQYEIGHSERVRSIETRALSLPGLHLLGNAYHGVGLPDMVRRAREQTRAAAGIPPGAR
jgi:oxygen-dependent protoporphyrinogen oxidase